jgi:hypothetical protein
LRYRHRCAHLFGVRMIGPRGVFVNLEHDFKQDSCTADRACAPATD